MTDTAIREVLEGKELSAIEEAVAHACKTYVNKDYVDFMIGIFRRHLSNSELSLEYISQFIKLRKDMIIKFGIELLYTLKDDPEEEEYPAGESVQKSERSKVIGTQGIMIGFGMTYAIYLHFLENNPNALPYYIQKERIPKTLKFCKMLEKIYKASCTGPQ